VEYAAGLAVCLIDGRRGRAETAAGDAAFP